MLFLCFYFVVEEEKRKIIPEKKYMGNLNHYSFFKKKILLIYFLEKGREGEREGEKRQCVVVSSAPPTGDLARNPGMCPDWESNRRPFDSQAGTQPLSHTSQGSTIILTNSQVSCCCLFRRYPCKPGTRTSYTFEEDTQ